MGRDRERIDEPNHLHRAARHFQTVPILLHRLYTVPRHDLRLRLPSSHGVADHRLGVRPLTCWAFPSLPKLTARFRNSSIVPLALVVGGHLLYPFLLNVRTSLSTPWISFSASDSRLRVHSLPSCRFVSRRHEVRPFPFRRQSPCPPQIPLSINPI